MTNEYLFAAQNDNIQAMAEINDREKYFGKSVKVVKGRKNIGFVGEIFWLKRTGYGNNPWTGWSTRIGIKNENGEIIWNNTNNIELT